MGCPGKRYGALHGAVVVVVVGEGGGVLAIVTFVTKNMFCSSSCRYQTDITDWGIFQLNSNGKGMRTLPCISEVCNRTRKACKLGEK